jgi:hypothetical protein
MMVDVARWQDTSLTATRCEIGALTGAFTQQSAVRNGQLIVRKRRRRRSFSVDRQI